MRATGSRALISLLLFLSCLSSVVVARRDTLWESDKYVDENMRPENITGLYYWMYGWIGSYYNGTLSMEMDMVDWSVGVDKDDYNKKPCSSLLNTTIELSYDAVLGFTETLQGDVNPLMFVLTAWEKGTNLTSARPLDDYQWWKLPIRTSSLSTLPKISYEISTTRDWNLTSTLLNPPDLSDPPTWNSDSSSFNSPSYSVSGILDHDPTKYAYQNPSIGLNFTHSTCESLLQSRYFGNTLLPGNDSEKYFPSLNVRAPKLSARFDNETASLHIEAFYSAHGIPDEKDLHQYETTGTVDEWKEPMIAGPVRISFLGKVDGNRSDLLVGQGNSTPAWEATLGFEKGLLDEEGVAGRVVRVMVYWYWVVVGCVVLVAL